MKFVNGGLVGLCRGEVWRTRRKPCPSATLSTTNPTWTSLVSTWGVGRRRRTSQASLRFFPLCLHVSRWRNETCFYVIRSGDRMPVGARLTAPIQTGPGAHQVSSLSPGGTVTGVWPCTPPHLAPKWKKEKSFISTPPLGFRDLLQGELFVFRDAVSLSSKGRFDGSCCLRNFGYRNRPPHRFVIFKSGIS